MSSISTAESRQTPMAGTVPWPTRRHPGDPTESGSQSHSKSGYVRKPISFRFPNLGRSRLHPFRTSCMVYTCCMVYNISVLLAGEDALYYLPL